MDVMVSMKWQVMPGMGGNFEPELYIAFRSYPATRSGRAAQMATLGRNTWQLRPGTGGNFPPEWVADLARNTHYHFGWIIYISFIYTYFWIV
jgi:hypothetical protein